VNEYSQSKRVLSTAVKNITSTTVDERPTWTVDELARAADTMTTTVRMYQAKGLLHPPAKRGRVAVYDQSHLDRLRLITDLQARGHSLAGIADLIEGYERRAPLSELLGLRTWSEPEPVWLPLVDLILRLGGEQLAPAVMMRAVDTGLVDLDGENAVVSDRRFLDIGSALVDLGVDADSVLDEWEFLAPTMATVADRFVALFEQQLLPQLDGKPLGDLAAVLDRLTDLAREVTIAALDTALRDRAEAYLHDE
jgi:DNA-binding transcriptional MerR regulator